MHGTPRCAGTVAEDEKEKVDSFLKQDYKQISWPWLASPRPEWKNRAVLF
jgi:hypothetical protein